VVKKSVGIFRLDLGIFSYRIEHNGKFCNKNDAKRGLTLTRIYKKTIDAFNYDALIILKPLKNSCIIIMALAIRKLKEAFARSFANVEKLPGHEITSRTMSNLL